MAWWLIEAAWACDGTTLRAQLEQAEQAYVALDIDAFRVAHAQAGQTLHCLGEPIDTDTAAGWHRLQGLAGSVAGDPELVASSFARARWLDPGHDMDAVIAPGHPLREVYASAEHGGPVELVEHPETVALRVDGLADSHRPLEHPVVLQAEEAGSWTTWALSPGDPSPTWAAPPPPERRLGVAPFAALGAGLVLGVAGADQYRRYARWEDSTELRSIEEGRRHMRASAACYGGAGAALVASGVLFVRAF